jgi:flagellar biosynthesis/type III secretory pathway protein FliH
MSTYETDFYAWTQAQATALRAKDWPALDVDNLAEELEGMARSDRRALGNHLKNLLLHLLKWTYQPDKRGPSWQDSIEEAREAIEDLLEESRASMEAETQRQFAKQYARARRKASRETGLALATFPEVCPRPVAQVLDEDFWPEDNRP